VTLAGVILFNYVGFENPHNACEEMQNPQRDILFALKKGAILTILLYSIPVLGILLVLPAAEVSGLGGLIDAIRAVFSIYGSSGTGSQMKLAGPAVWIGQSMAILFILCLLSSGTAWMMGSDRALAVSGYDGAAPAWLGVISKRFGTPVRVNLLSGFIATAILIAARELSQGDSAKYFNAVLNIAVSTTLMSYMGIFPSIWRLRSSYVHVQRPFRVPAVSFLAIWLTLWIAFATIQIFAPGLGVDWFGGSFAPKGWVKAERFQYLLIEVIPVATFALLGVLFWALGAKTRTRDVLDIKVEKLDFRMDTFGSTPSKHRQANSCMIIAPSIGGE
jgi:amino acid transporter